MDEYINRTMMLAKIYKAAKDGALWSDWSTDAVIAFIERQPLANVIPARRREWILKRDDINAECWQCDQFDQCEYWQQIENGTYKGNN